MGSRTEVKAILTVRDNRDKFVDSWLYLFNSWKFLKCTPFAGWILWMNYCLPLKKNLRSRKPFGSRDTSSKLCSIQYVQTAQESFKNWKCIDIQCQARMGTTLWVSGASCPWRDLFLSHMFTRERNYREKYVFCVALRGSGPWLLSFLWSWWCWKGSSWNRFSAQNPC